MWEWGFTKLRFGRLVAWGLLTMPLAWLAITRVYNDVNPSGNNIKISPNTKTHVSCNTPRVDIIPSIIFVLEILILFCAFSQVFTKEPHDFCTTNACRLHCQQRLLQCFLPLQTWKPFVLNYNPSISNQIVLIEGIFQWHMYTTYNYLIDSGNY